MMWHEDDSRRRGTCWLNGPRGVKRDDLTEHGWVVWHPGPTGPVLHVLPGPLAPGDAMAECDRLAGGAYEPEG